MNQHIELKQSIVDLLQRYQSLVLATVDQSGTPNCSHAPYLLKDGGFHILVSGLAKHTTNLLQSGQCHVQIMADEQETVNPFARKRLSYLCSVAVVLRSPKRRPNYSYSCVNVSGLQSTCSHRYLISSS
jgi:putative heme iron utilization protein